MTQPRHALGFGDQSRRFVAGVAQHLDRDPPEQQRVSRDVDRRHGSLTRDPFDDIAAQRCTRRHDLVVRLSLAASGLLQGRRIGMSQGQGVFRVLEGVRRLGRGVTNDVGGEHPTCRASSYVGLDRVLALTRLPSQPGVEALVRRTRGSRSLGTRIWAESVGGGATRCGGGGKHGCESFDPPYGWTASPGRLRSVFSTHAGVRGLPSHPAMAESPSRSGWSAPSCSISTTAGCYRFGYGLDASGIFRLAGCLDVARWNAECSRGR